MSEQHDPFNDPSAVAAYAEGPARNVPGWADMLRMVDLLLAERVAEDGDVLVVGAGGGLELKRFAESHFGWRFLGVDPSHEMLKLAQSTLGSFSSRVSLHEGYVETASPGPFDAATCLLTLHFVPLEARRRMLAEIRQRLRPGAPFVLAHLSFPQAPEERDTWLCRYAAFVASSGIDPAKARAAAEAVGARLSILCPSQDESMLYDAGFSSVQLFYAGFAFRGWVAYA
ncbi:MAG: class I SAM-dependent methyltransferase [Betaproteobacteria bacterium]|jgi:tRNA (cmo5U34)-methyltransferase|nr:class I SAM-dependent methyltransferase [Betaproteobacteria bacterium]MBK9784067.1 class I SAM-dependent methyltransferase [Candidatus Dechloromonas phosphorivorans]